MNLGRSRIPTLQLMFPNKFNFTNALCNARVYYRTDDDDFGFNISTEQCEQQQPRPISIRSQCLSHAVDDMMINMISTTLKHYNI